MLMGPKLFTVNQLAAQIKLVKTCKLIHDPFWIIHYLYVDLMCYEVATLLDSISGKMLELSTRIY